MFDSATLWTVPARLLCPCSSPGQNTGVGSCSLLQGIFPTQGWNTGLPHCRQILYCLNHEGSPRILEWASPFSRRSSWFRKQTGVSCTEGGFFTSWATREAQNTKGIIHKRVNRLGLKKNLKLLLIERAIQRIDKQAMDWKEVITNSICNRGLESWICM